MTKDKLDALVGSVPDTISSEEELDEFMSRPQLRTIELMKRLKGDVIILGVSGKMGVSLAELALRSTNAAGIQRNIIGVARFSDSTARAKLERAGVETIACDLLDPESVAQLPNVENVIFMAGRKFGTGSNTELTWAMNTIVPAIVARKFAGSKIVAFSTGCVYPFVDPARGGCTTGTPVSPVGEYAQSCLGRERVFEHYSIANETPTCIVRLNYAIDLRYGVLHDIARSIHESGSANVNMGFFNIIWQGDANAIALMQLENCASPARIVNLTGSETLSTREVAASMAAQLNVDVSFSGIENPLAYLNDAEETLSQFGGTSVDVPTMIRWNADWVRTDGRSLSKPTHFEVNDGSY